MSDQDSNWAPSEYKLRITDRDMGFCISVLSCSINYFHPTLSQKYIHCHIIMKYIRIES